MIKKLLLVFSGVLIFFACVDEIDADSANRDTFMRFLGSEHNHTAVLAMEDELGGEYALLANMDIKVDNLTDFSYKIRFYKMSQSGSLLNTYTFPPEFTELEDDPSVANDTLDGYRASSFIQLPGDEGYLIVGESIYTDKGPQQPRPTRMLLIRMRPNGTVDSGDIAFFASDRAPGGVETSLHGRAVTIADDGNYLILGNITLVNNQSSDLDMYVAKVDKDDLSVIWKREYGDGSTKVANRLFYRDANIVWGGSVELVNSSEVRLIRAPENSQFSNSSSNIGSPVNNEVINDFCQTLGGYAFVGSTVDPVGDATEAQDIFFNKLSTASSELVRSEPIDFGGSNDVAVSVTDAIDGGYMVLATVTSGVDDKSVPPNQPVGNGGQDFLLLKLDNNGGVLNKLNYGGPDDEEAASIRITRDRKSYLVFGTTSFGNVKKLMLMKVGADGILR